MEQSNTSSDDSVTASVRWPEPRKPGMIFLILGVLFPALVVLLELVTRMCADELFDPMPTIWHVVLVSFVPVANFLVWRSARGSTQSHVRLVRMANGAAIGIASYYTLLFAPLLPIALMGIVVGIGLLPMAPLFSLVVAIRGYFYMRRVVSATDLSRKGRTALGAAVALSVLALLCASEVVTFMGMRLASSANVSERTRGLQLLRWAGSEEIMLRACYPHRRRASAWLSVLVCGGGPSVGEARRVYYQVTGKTFDDPADSKYTTPRGGFFSFRGLTFDSDHGGTRVGRKVEQLALRSSAMDGSVDPDAAMAYLEWTLEFENDSWAQAEARAHIGLPPGGVVSRLTLWIDGEEREAAFAGRGEVRKAYQKIVRRKRDPALITSDGPDQILLQCFPVPPRGGTMRLRIGITCPLVSVEGEQGFLRLPHFVNRNFDLGDVVRHQVWIESSRSISVSAGSLVAQRNDQGGRVVHGELTDAQLKTPASVLRLTRSPEVPAVWAPDRIADDGHLVLQTLDIHRASVPSSVILVLDGSKSMAPFASQIAQAVRGLPQGMRFAAILAGDEPSYLWKSESAASQEAYDALARHIEKQDYAGGRDNVPALSLACEMAAKNPNGATILWIHGPQPVELTSAQGLRQQFTRRSPAPALYEIQAEPGRNRILVDLEGVPQIRHLARINDLGKDLERLFTAWRNRSEAITFKRERVANDPGLVGSVTARRTSDHLVRLWALQEVAKLRASKSSEDRKQAVTVAARYSLVTPVSGAVVLESAAQYREAGLAPVNPDRVPTVPEPETWLLLIVVLITIIMMWLVTGRRGLRCVSA